MTELRLEAKLSPLPPVVIGGMLVVPIGLLAKMAPDQIKAPAVSPDTQAAAARARQIVMEVERGLGYEPVDRELEKLGYDVESRVPVDRQTSLPRGQRPRRERLDDHRYQE